MSKPTITYAGDLQMAQWYYARAVIMGSVFNLRLTQD